MEAKVAKIGLVILIATVAFRFMLSEKQEVELYSIFNAVNRNMDDFDFDKADFDAKVFEVNANFANDYSGIRTKAEAQYLQQQYLSRLLPDEDEDQIPSDYFVHEDFEMFSHLNSSSYAAVEEGFSEPLENYNTINASMKLFFTPAK